MESVTDYMIRENAATTWNMLIEIVTALMIAMILKELHQNSNFLLVSLLKKMNVQYSVYSR